MNYILVILPQAGQITPAQSCAFLHGVDWMWSVGLCRLMRGRSAKETALRWTPVGLHKVGSFIIHLRSFRVVPSVTSAEVAGLAVVGKRVKSHRSQGLQGAFYN
ncbi:hypothetical protein AVEN_126690-1 [Araneus ventricosus]|uniref:Uncharacterized protein n=1 Tax=Araneus ventricosus TaxID=182803 RepID=A0A4Y2IC70_ARAVE|nr:hypothetical protein AVEN_126690-1 [Araneus ventricosus]